MYFNMADISYQSLIKLKNFLTSNTKKFEDATLFYHNHKDIEYIRVPLFFYRF